MTGSMIMVYLAAFFGGFLGSVVYDLTWRRLR